MQESYAGRRVRLRWLRDDDLETIVRLYRATSNYFDEIGYGTEPVSTIEIQNDLRATRGSAGLFLYAIERVEDDIVVGLADVRLESTMSDAATIALLLIGEPYQRLGYGSDAADLLETALCASDEIEFLMAGVAETSELGQRFWTRRGYTYTGSTTHDPLTSRTTTWLAKRCAGTTP